MKSGNDAFMALTKKCHEVTTAKGVCDKRIVELEGQQKVRQLRQFPFCQLPLASFLIGPY